jgi:hypothetical protein
MYFNSITTGANSEAGIPYPSGAAHVLVETGICGIQRIPMTLL